MTPSATATAARRFVRAGRAGALVVGALVVGALAMTVSLVLPGGWTTARAGSAPGDAARLVEQMRSAAGATDFTAEVTVMWRTAAGAPREDIVDVRSVDGALEVSSRHGKVVLDEDGQTFVRDELGWSSPESEPRPERRPAPDAHWTLTTRRTSFLGRPATVVLASRAGDVGQRLVIDDDTRLLLARDVLAGDDRVERGFRFDSLELGPRPSASAAVSTPTLKERTTTSIDTVPDGYHAPERVGAGHVLVSRSSRGDQVHLVYSDGLFSMSVREQRGALDWSALPSDGVDTSVDGAQARRYAQALGEVVVWERDGVVFTAVSDAPPAVFEAALAGIDPDAGTAEQVVDFVLGPFGFD
jgi:hypothetical protein